MRYIDRVKRFGRGCITEEEYYYLYEFIIKNNIRDIIEFGPGTSTFAFLEADCNILALETSHKWKKYYDEKFARFKNVKVIMFNKDRDIRLPKEVPSSFDMAFIDGPPARREVKGPARLQPCRFCENITNVIMFHDGEREGERKTLKLMENKGWNVRFAPVLNENIGICCKGDYVFPGDKQ
jgi:hypothetical protein